MVKLTAHESLSRETVRRRLAENDLKPWRKDMWCIPQVDADYVARMEDVLDLYTEAPDPKRPVVCFDESPIQLIGEVRQLIPPKPGQIERYDCEYRRDSSSAHARQTTNLGVWSSNLSGRAQWNQRLTSIFSLAQTSQILTRVHSWAHIMSVWRRPRAHPLVPRHRGFDSLRSG